MLSLDPSVAVWGAALFILLILSGLVLLISRTFSDGRPQGVGMLLAGLFFVALLVSGLGVTALANWMSAPDVRLAPGAVARWSPAVLALLLAVGALTRRRRAT